MTYYSQGSFDLVRIIEGEQFKSYQDTCKKTPKVIYVYSGNAGLGHTFLAAFAEQEDYAYRISVSSLATTGSFMELFFIVSFYWLYSLSLCLSLYAVALSIFFVFPY